METDELEIGSECEEIIEITSVEPLENYKLRVTLSNGRRGIFDVSQFIDEGVFLELNDPGYFRRVYIDYGTLVWPNGQDIDPEIIEISLQHDQL
jgi:hypothetical protein